MIAGEGGKGSVKTAPSQGGLDNWSLASPRRVAR